MQSAHSLTTRNLRRLGIALLLSLLLHVLPFVSLPDFAQKRPSTAAPIVAELRPPTPKPPPADLPLTMPEQPKPRSEPPPPPPPKAARPQLNKARPWTEVVRQHLKQLDAAGQFYPAEAIAQGQQGEVLVLIVVDESGAVAAARVEQGSGYPLLDAAALRAVRSLRSLPSDAPREALLPVRFRLR